MEMSIVKKVQKRDGRIVDFEPNKIVNAIRKAFIAVRGEDEEMAQKLSDEVIQILSENFKEQIPGVEDVQDIVEKVLIDEEYTDVAKAYILYREKRAEIRRVKSFLGVKGKGLRER